ncbi:epoxide hydrolase 4 [Patella vulgata]|uniref:epoxide hydrolase 4 n=1 Tax=Patella vulgata TaxID=6465 RepID=UPI002180251D|nr:epoxide hydrolase 4 [Patella vulgata]
MAVADVIQTVVTFSLGCFFANFVVLKMIWGIIRNPSKAFSVKDRSVPPSCLNDPSLGTHNYIQLKNIRLHYVANGDENKPLMLFVHGFPEFWYSWRYQLKEFSKDYRCVAIDQRGYNDSDKPAGMMNYKVGMMVEDLRQLIPALGYKTCVLVGHDWGGAICWAFAAAHKEMVDKLVVMNCPHRAAMAKYLRSHRSQFLKSWYMYFFQLPWLPELYWRMNDLEVLASAFTSEELGVKSGRFTEKDLEAYKYAFSKPGAATSALNYYRAAMKTFNRDKRLVEVPTRLIWGCKDGALDTGLAEATKPFVKDMTISYIPEASHWVMMDEPEEVNKYMRQFLNQK